MKKRIGTLLLALVAVGALLAGPALARDNDDFNGRWGDRAEWREHHPYQGYQSHQNYQYYGRPSSLYREWRYQNYRFRPEPPWSYGRSRHHTWRTHHDYDHDGD